MGTVETLDEIARHARLCQQAAAVAEQHARTALEKAQDAWSEAGRARIEAQLVATWLEQMCAERGAKVDAGQPWPPVHLQGHMPGNTNPIHGGQDTEVAERSGHGAD